MSVCACIYVFTCAHVALIASQNEKTKSASNFRSDRRHGLHSMGARGASEACPGERWRRRYCCCDVSAAITLRPQIVIGTDRSNIPAAVRGVPGRFPGGVQDLSNKNRLVASAGRDAMWRRPDVCARLWGSTRRSVMHCQLKVVW